MIVFIMLKNSLIACRVVFVLLFTFSCCCCSLYFSSNRVYQSTFSLWSSSCFVWPCIYFVCKQWTITHFS